ncbi:Uncharacterised protein [Vibrio cholerae]|nr:Uncharacterised protein [Vibrio cholerae]
MQLLEISTQALLKRLRPPWFVKSRMKSWMTCLAKCRNCVNKSCV